MILFFLLRVILVLCLLSENIEGMTEQERKKEALMLWREKKIVVFEQALPRFPIIESTECLSNAYDLKNCLHPFSFFCKELNYFYVKRLVKYSCYNTQGCEFSHEYIQPHFDRFDPATRKLTVNDLPCRIANENCGVSCEGVWYDRDHQDEAKDLIVKLATSIYPTKEKKLNLDGVLLSNDFFYLLVVSLDQNGDRLVLFYPYRPLFTDEVFYRLADCFMRFI